MTYLLILASVSAFALNGVMTRCFQLYIQKHTNSIRVYQAAYAAIASAAYIAVGLVSGEAFGVGLLPFAAAFGVCFAGASLFSAECMKLGFMSISSVIINLSLLIPLLFSVVVLGDEFRVTSAVGLALLAATFVLSSLSSEKQSKKDFKKWLLFVVIAFLANGFSAVVQKSYKLTDGGASLMLFMGAAYGVASVCFIIVYIAGGGVGEAKRYTVTPAVGVSFAAVALAAGLGSCLGNGLLGKLCTEVSGGILYPCINGGLAVMISLSSFILFKEPVLKSKLLAVVTGIAAIILLNL